MAVEGTSDFAAMFAETDRRAYLEQRLYVLSPLGTFATTVAIFAVLTGTFLLAAMSEHVVLLAGNGHVASPARMAFTLALLLCTALYLQRVTRMRERLDRDAFAAVLKPGALERRNLVQLTPGEARLGRSTLIGVIAGLALSWPMYGASIFAANQVPYATFAWFLAVNTLLIASFVRGVELSRTGSRATAEAIDNDLVVDLLRIDTLSVWGRSAARFALIWFGVSAVGCLFFVDSGLTAFSVSLVASFLALGIWMFVRPMERVHHKIRAAKSAELERIRGEIDQVRPAASIEPNAAIRLQGLLAYETRIAAAPEWPFDQTTLWRVAASALILAVPWFGQALAGYVIERMA